MCWLKGWSKLKIPSLHGVSLFNVYLSYTHVDQKLWSLLMSVILFWSFLSLLHFCNFLTSAKSVTCQPCQIFVSQFDENRLFVLICYFCCYKKPLFECCCQKYCTSLYIPKLSSLFQNNFPCILLYGPYFDIWNLRFALCIFFF